MRTTYFGHIARGSMAQPALLRPRPVSPTGEPVTVALAASVQRSAFNDGVAVVGTISDNESLVPLEGGHSALLREAVPTPATLLRAQSSPFTGDPVAHRPARAGSISTSDPRARGSRAVPQQASMAESKTVVPHESQLFNALETLASTELSVPAKNSSSQTTKAVAPAASGSHENLDTLTRRSAGPRLPVKPSGTEHQSETCARPPLSALGRGRDEPEQQQSKTVLLQPPDSQVRFGSVDLAPRAEPSIHIGSVEVRIERPVAQPLPSIINRSSSASRPPLSRDFGAWGLRQS
jgi:hypothetical protein